MMKRLVVWLVVAGWLSTLHAAEVQLLLPGGKPAANVEVTVSYYQYAGFGASPERFLKGETGEGGEAKNVDQLNVVKLKATKLGVVDLENAQVASTVIVDVAGYALHVHCYSHFGKTLQLFPDHRVTGRILYEDGTPVKHKTVCMGRGVGLIWGPIYLPRGLNPAVTDANGQFSMRQVVLLDGTQRGCQSDIVLKERQTLAINGYIGGDLAVTFFDPKKKKIEGVKVTVKKE